MQGPGAVCYDRPRSGPEDTLLVLYKHTVPLVVATSGQCEGMSTQLTLPTALGPGPTHQLLAQQQRLPGWRAETPQACQLRCHRDPQPQPPYVLQWQGRGWGVGPVCPNPRVTETWARDSRCRDMLPTAHIQHTVTRCINISVVEKEADVPSWATGMFRKRARVLQGTRRGRSHACETMMALLPVYTEHSGLQGLRTAC